MPRLLGEVRDAATGDVVAARVQVITSQGEFAHPEGALLKVGTGQPFFYSDGRFEVDVPGGPTRFLVERGTEYRPYDLTTDVREGDTAALDLALERWPTLGDQGWHPDNTHLHYDENEGRPDDRLRLDPRVENLRMTAVSILKRRDLEYASNKYPPGVLNDFSTEHHHVQCGEETRHNAEDPWSIGYGRVMLLNLETFVQPVIRASAACPAAPRVRR